MQWHGRSVRLETGGRIRYARKKRRSEIGRAPADTHIGETRRKLIRTYGGNRKVRSMRASYASVADPKTGVTKKAVIENVEEVVRTV